MNPNCIPNQEQKDYLCSAANRNTTGGAAALGLLYYFGIKSDCNNNNLRESDSKSVNSNMTEKLTNCLYPNPATNTIHIGTCLSSGTEVQASIFDQMGILVKANIGITGNEINVLELKDGLYILRLQQGNELQNFKFVKQ